MSKSEKFKQLKNDLERIRNELKYYITVGKFISKERDIYIDGFPHEALRSGATEEEEINQLHKDVAELSVKALVEIEEKQHLINVELTIKQAKAILMFLKRANFDTFLNLAENQNQDEAYLMRDSFTPISRAITEFVKKH